MSIRIPCGVLALVLFWGGSCTPAPPPDYPIQPVSFTDVEVRDAFWAPRIETNRQVTIPYAFEMNESTGRLDNLRKAAGMMEGPYLGRRFNDTDVYKAMEGGAYSMAIHPDPQLEAQVDEMIAIITAAQEDDGYLYAARTVDPANPAPGAGPERWIHLQGSHELYNSGHLFEAAVAHFQATGKTSFLDVATKNADLLLEVFGPDKRLDSPGHQVIEIGLPKLYRATGNRAYLELAKFFLDQRGKEHAYEDYPEGPFAMYNGMEYRQAHLPVLEQTEAVGHAVRASYMYAGMADVAALTGDLAYVEAIDRIWSDVVEHKLYLHGGIGARSGTEAFGDAYELPNRRAYAETCAAIGNVLWNHRMFLLHGHGRYMDVLERTLYNGLLSGVSLSGDRFFYQNRLESAGGYERSPWFEVSCCPGNMVRFLPSLPGYVYASREGELFVNLFVTSRAQVAMGRSTVEVSQETAYPWEGEVEITLRPSADVRFALNLRIPGWARSQPVPGSLYRYEPAQEEPVLLWVNGVEEPVEVVNGYTRLERIWRGGDQVRLLLPMSPRVVMSHEAVADNRGKVAFERGPLVFAAEEADHPGGVLDLAVSPGSPVRAEFRPDLMGGTVVLVGEGLKDGRAVPLTLVPYALWANRTPGEMVVWMTRQ